MSSNAPAQASSKGSNVMPGLEIFLGLVGVLWWAYSTVMDIQTSEALIQGGRAINTFKPNWDIVMQPYDLFTGAQMSLRLAEAIYWAWGTELVFLICLIGWEAAHHGVKQTNQHLTGLFKTGSWVLVIINFVASFMYGDAAGFGFWGRLAFASITAFSVMFTGTGGLHLIEKGLSRMTH